MAETASTGVKKIRSFQVIMMLLSIAGGEQETAR
jgi:hypothetical protein